MPNITDPEIWDKLSTEAKVKWLKIQADLAAIERCRDCGHYVCNCGGDI